MVQNSLCDQLILFGQREDKLSAAPERVWRFFVFTLVPIHLRVRRASF